MGQARVSTRKNDSPTLNQVLRGCSSSQLTPRSEHAFYNAQRLAQQEESRQERQRRQARRPARGAGTCDHTCVRLGTALLAAPNGGAGLHREQRRRPQPSRAHLFFVFVVHTMSTMAGAMQFSRG